MVWKKGPGFCRGQHESDEKNIPEKYLPEELFNSNEESVRSYRRSRSYNDTGVKIRISSLFPQLEDTAAETIDADEDSDGLRITVRAVRQLKSLISVNSLVIDKCDRLWFIDTGVLDYYDNANQRQTPAITVQRPAIWVVDIRKKDLFLIHQRFELNDRVVPTPAGLRGFAVDVPGACSGTSGVAYIANAIDNRMVVYDMDRQSAWFFEDSSMTPSHGPPSRLNFGEDQINIKLGITDVAIGFRDDQKGRSVYYVPYSSNDLYVISTEHLKYSDYVKPVSNEFNLIGNRGSDSQTESIVFDPRNGILFYAEVQTKSIKCWNVRKSLRNSSTGTIYQDERLNYPADLSVSKRFGY